MNTVILGGWLMGLTIAEIIAIVLSMGNDYSQDFTTLLGFIVIGQIIFAIMGARRLMKE